MRGLELKEYIEQISSEITARVSHERDVLLEFLEQDRGSNGKLFYCPLVDCSPRKKYRAGLLEAVRVIEETRRSFKSRQLEELRKKLQSILAEDADSAL